MEGDWARGWTRWAVEGTDWVCRWLLGGAKCGGNWGPLGAGVAGWVPSGVTDGATTGVGGESEGLDGRDNGAVGMWACGGWVGGPPPDMD